MSFIPSCDNREDAIKSLSEIYVVSIEEIDGVLREHHVREIAEDLPNITVPNLLYVMSSLLKASSRTDITHACYYHSTSYSGCPSWFDEGLLGSSQGVERFLDKISDFLSPEMQLAAKQEFRRVVTDRSENEGFTAEMRGPYAWDTFTAASSSQNGINYRVPEALLPSCFYGNEELANELGGIIAERLKPIVVKFKGKVSNFDTCCATLWAYLLRDNGECHLTHTFMGNGQAIPKDDIVALMNVQ